MISAFIIILENYFLHKVCQEFDCGTQTEKSTVVLYRSFSNREDSRMTSDEEHNPRTNHESIVVLYIPHTKKLVLVQCPRTNVAKEIFYILALSKIGHKCAAIPSELTDPKINRREKNKITTRDLL